MRPECWNETGVNSWTAVFGMRYCSNVPQRGCDSVGSRFHWTGRWCRLVPARGLGVSWTVSGGDYLCRRRLAFCLRGRFLDGGQLPNAARRRATGDGPSS